MKVTGAGRRLVPAGWGRCRASWLLHFAAARHAGLVGTPWSLMASNLSTIRRDEARPSMLRRQGGQVSDQGRAACPGSGCVYLGWSRAWNAAMGRPRRGAAAILGTFGAAALGWVERCLDSGCSREIEPSVNGRNHEQAVHRRCLSHDAGAAGLGHCSPGHPTVRRALPASTSFVLALRAAGAAC
jgi:hypothetical protein